MKQPGKKPRVPAMYLEQLLKPDLLLICEELGIDARKIKRKPLLVKAIQASGTEEKQIKECCDIIEERKAAREAEREAEERKVEREAEKIRLEAEVKGRKAKPRN